MVIRAPSPEDARDIRRIAWENNLPIQWRWPPGKHGLVVEHKGEVRAFCVLDETVYGLVVSELWEEQSRTGFLALGTLARKIEEIAQRLADERGEALACGGVVRNDKERHQAALEKRGYSGVAKVFQKVFLPQAPRCETEQVYAPTEAAHG